MNPFHWWRPDARGTISRHALLAVFHVLTLDLLAAGAPSGDPSPRTVSILDCAPATPDYTLMSWIGGWSDGAPRDPALLQIVTGRYQAVFDPFKASLVRLSPIPVAALQPSVRARAPRVPGQFPGDPQPASGWIAMSRKLDRDEVSPDESTSGAGLDYAAAGRAVVADQNAWLQLDAASLEMTAQRGGNLYHCVRAATNRQDSMNFPVRIIESGRYVQRFDVLQLVFEDDHGDRLDAEGRLEVVAWPDSIRLVLELTPSAGSNTAPVTLGLRLKCTAAFEGRPPEVAEQPSTPRPGTYSSELVITPRPISLPRRTTASVDAPPPSISLSATDITHGSPLKVEQDSARGWHRIVLPSQSWSVAADPDHLERVRFSMTNDSPAEQTVRLLFDDPSGTPAITGLTPMLREPDGSPTGIPVQISKNWHRQEKRRMLYEGPWLHAFTILRLPPRSRTDAEFTVAFARWGGVPAASHAQLCLIGWGWNQVWDQAAIGSWGESICYEPDAIQVRCRIDDVRPLMVWGMGDGQRKWTWTHNVGGGDFLVYLDEHGSYQPWRGVRTAYLSQGPNLTDVIYSGVTADGHIACRVEVSSPRCDDVNRVYHRLRYDVLKPTRFSRLAFYQVGSDRYHWHQFNRMARGNTDGLIEEWTPGRGGKSYLRTGIPCPGEAPWFSLHGAIAADHLKPVQGGWATRGLIVRSWKARLSGKPAALSVSVYGTEAGGVPSANLELSPPPDVTDLQVGDFVEAELEFVILPMSADDYYGPNENLRTALREQGNSWRAVHRLARGNDLGLHPSAGRVTSAYPPVIAIGAAQRADLTVTGGMGHVPMTFTGLKTPRDWVLQIDRGEGLVVLDQSVHGKDFSQASRDPVTGTWQLTYNIPLDSPRDLPATRRIVFRGGRSESR